MKSVLLIVVVIQSLTSFGQVILSEMQSSNSSTISDNMGEYDDWIEIHNPTIDSIEIGGLILKDQLDTWMIPTGDPATLLPPGGYFLLWADDQEIQGPDHTNFKLASGGEFLGLYESDGTTVIDSITIPALNANDSYIRCNTGWIITSAPTPLNTNNCSANTGDLNPPSDLYQITVLNNEDLIIEAFNYSPNKQRVNIHSMEGKKLIEKSLSGKQTVLSLHSLQGGIYIVTISSSGSLYSKKIWLGE